MSKNIETAHRPNKHQRRWGALAWPALLIILTTALLAGCLTTSESDIHLVMGPSNALFPYGVRTAGAIRVQIDRASMLIRYADTMRNVAPDNAGLLLEEAMAIADATYQQPNISQEKLGNTPYYSTPPLSFSASIQLANLYIDIAQTLFIINDDDELNRQIILEALTQSLFHLKLIEHGTAHSEALLRLFALSNRLGGDGAQLRDTCISIAVSYKILPIKLVLLSDMAIAMYANQRIIANNLLGHFDVARIQSSRSQSAEALIADLMALKLDRFIPEYQSGGDATLSVDTDSLPLWPRAVLVSIAGYIADIAPQLFDQFYDNPFDTVTKLDILLEYIQSTDSQQQQALYTRQFITEYETLSNASQYTRLHTILPFAIDYLPDSAPMLIAYATRAGQNYFQSLRAFTIAAQQYLQQGDIPSAQLYFERIFSRLPTAYPVADALNYYATYEKIYGRQRLMELMITHRTEPTISSARLLLLLQSSLAQPFSLQEQPLLAQIVAQ